MVLSGNLNEYTVKVTPATVVGQTPPMAGSRVREDRTWATTLPSPQGG